MSNFSPDFELYGQKINGEKKEKFAEFSALLKEFNKKYNLTAITDEKEIYYKHFLDSAAGERWIKQGVRVTEIGSGAGFPSVPLKILRDDLSFTLIESTGKKCDFLRVVKERLSLTGVEIVNGRAEEIARREEYREKADVCLARAVARLNTLAEYCLPFVKKGGIFLSYKGEAAEEVAEAKRAVSLLGGGNVESYGYELPEGYGTRTLVRIEKIRNTPAAYPRGNGKERKNPLV